MGGFLEKVKHMMLGTEYEEEGYDDEYTDEADSNMYDIRGYESEAESARVYRGASDGRGRQVEYFKPSRTSRSTKNATKIVNFQENADTPVTQIVITFPLSVQDASFVSDYIRDQKACVVNLEGVPRECSQRIADFIGGAVYALDAEIQRINNEIFIIAPRSVKITGDLKDELTSSGHIFAMASSFK